MYYKIRKGDNPEKISSQFGMSVLDLFKANRGVFKFTTGMSVKLPGTGRPPKPLFGLGGETGEIGGEVTTPQTNPNEPLKYGTTGTGEYRLLTPENYHETEPQINSDGSQTDTTADDWSATMGENVGEITLEQWNSGIRPQYITVANQKKIGVTDAWMRENGYVLNNNDTWGKAMDIVLQENQQSQTTAQGGGVYTETFQWHVGT